MYGKNCEQRHLNGLKEARGNLKMQKGWLECHCVAPWSYLWTLLFTNAAYPLFICSLQT